ncbi:MAG: CHAD domain-containing protein [Sulfolobales archaeon]|nr:CHAD domain-containing protein [Sulfolobales archaeon]
MKPEERPEFYANNNLRKALKFDPSPESVHDTRVYLRKYLTLSLTLSRLYHNPDCIYYSKEAVRILGRIRDADVSGCIPIDRKQLTLKVTQILPKISSCYLPKIYGSRLVVFEKIREIYNQIQIEDFHEFRKKVRILYYLTESVGEDPKPLKDISRELGDIRDQYLKEVCTSTVNKNKKLSFDPRLVEETKAIVREIIMRNEFHHLKKFE